jgi:hypothetical protein
VQLLPKIAGYGLFLSWQGLPNGPVTTNPEVTATPNEPFSEVVFYGWPVPDPCQGLRNKMAADAQACSADGLSTKACITLLKQDSAQLSACEAEYGEN